MGETIIKEPVVGEPGAVEPPAQPPSETPTEPSAVDEESLKAILEPLVQAEVEKRTQSVKDKRIAKQESRISGLEDTLAQYKELQAEGMSEKQIVQFMKVNELLASQGQEVPTDAPPEEEPAVQPTVAGEEYLSSVLQMSGLTDSDPDVIELLRKERDPFKRIAAIGELTEARKQAQTTPARAGATLPSGVGEPVVSEDIGSLSERLNELVDLPVQTPESEAERAEIRAKINKLEPIQQTIVGV